MGSSVYITAPGSAARLDISNLQSIARRRRHVPLNTAVMQGHVGVPTPQVLVRVLLGLDTPAQQDSCFMLTITISYVPQEHLKTIVPVRAAHLEAVLTRIIAAVTQKTGTMVVVKTKY